MFILTYLCKMILILFCASWVYTGFPLFYDRYRCILIWFFRCAGVFSSLNKFKYYDRWDFNELALRMILVVSAKELLIKAFVSKSIDIKLQWQTLIPDHKFRADHSCKLTIGIYYKGSHCNFQISPPPRKFDPKSLKLQDTTPTPGVVTILKISSIVVHEIAQLHNFR